MIITDNASLPFSVFHSWTSSCHSTGGAKDAGEARPAREQKHICTVRAERTVGAASCRQRSDRRHPDQVWKVNVNHHPVKQTDAARKSDTIKQSLSKSARSLSYLSLVRRMRTERCIVYLSSLVQFSCWTLSSIRLITSDLVGSCWSNMTPCWETGLEADVIW